MTRDEKALQNRLKEIRTRLGYSQQELAQAAGVARQTIGGIEAGTYSVSMVVALRIARALGCRVEELFWLEDERAMIAGTPAQGREHNGPVQLAKIDGRWVAHSLTGDSAFRHEMVPADGELLPSGQIALFDEEEALTSTILLAGCAPALSLWARSAERWLPELRVRWVHANSEQALGMLARGEVHAAGVHFAGDNLPKVEAALKGPATLVTLGVWEEGLALAPGNPKGVRHVVDLAQPGVTLVNREPGAACRALLDEECESAGILASTLVGYDHIAHGHVEVAQAVAQWRADAGITVSAVARAYGLAFVPLRSVRYELALRPGLFSLPRIQQLIETLQHRWIRTQLIEIGGYDISASGETRGTIAV
ncbi:MAG: substrate-binding domain-containing protein [Armatimonas sp.]